MAQARVTEFFSTRKRKTDFQPSKRQKLYNHGEITYEKDKSLLSAPEVQPGAHVGTKTDECKTNTKRVTRQRKASIKSNQEKPKTRAIARLSSNDKSCNQKSISDFVPASGSSVNSPPITPPTADKFEFKLSTALPSETDARITQYQEAGSPHGTPTKRSGKSICKATQIKRKRKSLESTFSELPVINDFPSTVSSNSIAVGLVEKDSTALSFTSDSTNTEPKKLEVASSKASNDCTGVDQQPAATLLLSTETSTKSKKQTSAEFKDMLSKCGKLADLKACLQRVNELSKDRKASKSKQKAKEAASTIEKVEENVSHAAAAKSDAQSEAVVPAYVKYKDLAATIPPTLTLPHKYKLLEDMFKGADTVISIMYNRLERCTFDKLKRSIQDMIRRNFEERHLGQIKHVYPDSYDIRQEKGLVDCGKKCNKYQMTIEPKIDGVENGSMSKRKDGRPVFSSIEVIKRKELFRSRLFDIVKRHHQTFLENFNPPLKVDTNKLTRWHPKFLLDNVPDIEPADLPKAPEEVKELRTARDILDHNTGRIPSKVEQALKKVADATETAEKLKQAASEAGTKSDTRKDSKGGGKSKAEPASTATSGISSSLLERIRAKEALKAQADMMRDEKTEKEIEILSRLPDMIKILRSFFITEKKPALTEDSVIVKLCDSNRTSISQSSVETHIEFMLNSFPEWITRVKVKSGTFLKIDRQMELSVLNAKISALAKGKQYELPQT